MMVDITDRLTRIIGQVSSGSSPGSIQVAAFGTYGTPWAFVQQRNASADQFGKRTVRVTISGTMLSWDFPGLTSWDILPGTIIYGVC
ncbi:hypothetical protein GQL56_09925 [Pseudomonas putida]|nr:hypothetical protein [Pseudomonas putida]